MDRGKEAEVVWHHVVQPFQVGQLSLDSHQCRLFHLYPDRRAVQGVPLGKNSLEMRPNIVKLR